MRALKILKQVTNRSTDSVDKYLFEVSKISLINSEEEVELTRRIRSGDEVALHKLVNANLRFVVSVAKQYQNSGLALGDLINDGNLGLIKAAKKFDETRGFKFISYAVWWIRQSILQAIAEHARVIRLPLNQIGTLNKINKVASLLEQQFEREPTPDELASILDMPSEEIAYTIKIGSRQTSLDSSNDTDKDFNLLDILKCESFPMPDSYLYQNSLKEDIRRAVSHLPANMAIVLTLYYGLNGTDPLMLDEIGENMNLTRERVRQIKSMALKKLKDGVIKDTFKSYMG